MKREKEDEKPLYHERELTPGEHVSRMEQAAIPARVRLEGGGILSAKSVSHPTKRVNPAMTRFAAAAIRFV
jgi:hypothetical protein